MSPQSWLARWPAIATPVFRAALVAITIGAFANGLRAPFVLDDFGAVIGNRSVQAPATWLDVLLPPPESYAAGRPILNLTFAVNHAIGGAVVGGYHLVNLAIHVAAALVLFGLVRRVLESPRIGVRYRRHAAPIALAVAALWAVHPVQPTAVTYIAQRAESLMGLFYLLTLYAFLRGAEPANRAWRAGAIIACALGMGTKEVMATAPLVVFLFDGVFVAASWREAWERRRGLHLSLAATWLILAGLMATSGLGKRAVGFEHGLSSIAYLCLETQAVTLYLLRAVWPVNLVFDYGANLPPPTMPALIGATALLTGLLSASVWSLWRREIAGLLGTVFFILLAPTSSVIPLAGQPIAESRMYLPLAAIVAAAVAAGVRFAPRACIIAVCVALAGLVTLTRQRNALLSDTGALWADTVAKRPLNERAAVMWSEELKQRGQLARAIEVLEATRSLRPNSAEMNNNLGVALLQAGKIPEAIERLRDAVRLRPGNAASHTNLARVLFRLGDSAAALTHFTEAARLGTDDVEVQNFIGLCLVQLGRHRESIPHFERAVQLAPGHADARINLERMRAVAR